MMNKECKQMNFNATFNSINGLTQKFIDNYRDILSNEFNDPQIFPVPEIMRDDIPRIVAISNGGHSQLMLSKINCAITTNFDDKFSQDINKCMEYFEKKIDTVTNIIHTFKDNEPLDLKFFGITAELIFHKKNPVQLLQNSLIKFNKKDICDINLQLSYVEREHYYVNVRFSNARIFINEINPLECGFLENEYNEGIQVVIDVNNRYAFSKGKTENEVCKLEDIKEIKSILKTTVDTLPDIYGRGVFNE